MPRKNTLRLPAPTCEGCYGTAIMMGLHGERCPDHDIGFIHIEGACVMCDRVHDGLPFDVDA